MGDRWGHKSGMMVAYVAHFLAVILALNAQNMYWVYGIFITIGAGQGAFMPSAMNLVYDFAGEQDTKTYMALIDSFMAPFVVLFLIVIGFLVHQHNYFLVLNILGGCLLFSIILLHFLVKDPRHSKELPIYADGFSS